MKTRFYISRFFGILFLLVFTLQLGAKINFVPAENISSELVDVKHELENKASAENLLVFEWFFLDGFTHLHEDKLKGIPYHFFLPSVDPSTLIIPPELI